MRERGWRIRPQADLLHVVAASSQPSPTACTLDISLNFFVIILNLEPPSVVFGWCAAAKYEVRFRALEAFYSTAFIVDPALVATIENRISSVDAIWIVSLAVSDHGHCLPHVYPRPFLSISAFNLASSSSMDSVLIIK